MLAISLLPELNNKCSNHMIPRLVDELRPHYLPSECGVDCGERVRVMESGVMSVDNKSSPAGTVFKWAARGFVAMTTIIRLLSIGVGVVQEINSGE